MAESGWRSEGMATMRLPSASAGAEEDSVLTETEMRRREKENLRRALRQTQWRIYGPDGAAELLGVKPTTLVSRIKKLGLRSSASPPRS